MRIHTNDYYMEANGLRMLLMEYYELYKHDWIRTHSETGFTRMSHSCFEEFLTNEYVDEEYMLSITAGDLAAQYEPTLRIQYLRSVKR